jgi:hypothetical protein
MCVNVPVSLRLPTDHFHPQLLRFTSRLVLFTEDGWRSYERSKRRLGACLFSFPALLCCAHCAPAVPGKLECGIKEGSMKVPQTSSVGLEDDSVGPLQCKDRYRVLSLPDAGTAHGVVITLPSSFLTALRMSLQGVFAFDLVKRVQEPSKQDGDTLERPTS